MRDDLPEDGIRSYLYERSSTHRHRGIDLPAPKGSPVYAAAGGVVVVASNVFRRGFSGYGRVVVVHADDGSYQLYAHLERALVPVSDRIEAGQQIATVGNSTFSTAEPTRESGGAHLHYEVSHTKYPQEPEAPRIDPVAYLRADHIHPLTGQRLGENAAPAPSSPSSAEPIDEGTPQSGGPFSSPFSHCPCCGQLLPGGKHS
jgi:hypothetical protein